METAAVIASLYEKFLRCGAISTDSRNVAEGSMFFALKGDKFDGNRFVLNALESGAAFAVADDPDVIGRATEAEKERIIIVRDTLEALQQLAAHHRYILGIPILAITGSNGKTTTKELVGRVLAQRFTASVTRGNLNNHIGVPLTLLSMTAATGFGVVEMGASAPGEIALLCRIAQPNYGVITNIGLAHLEGFKSPEGVKRGKGELFDYLASNGGVAFYRSEDEVLADMAASRPDLHAIPYSEVEGEIENNLEGDYNRRNIAAAVAIGDYFEVDAGRIAEAIKSYHPDNNRSQAVSTPHNSLILDMYNANPSSMQEAIAHFSAMQPKQHPYKTVILGDMLELGEWSQKEHAHILDILSGTGIGEAYLVGDNFAKAASGLYEASPGLRVATFRNAEEFAAHLRGNPLRGRTVLIKGSRGIRLESIVELL